MKRNTVRQSHFSETAAVQNRQIRALTTEIKCIFLLCKTITCKTKLESLGIVSEKQNVVQICSFHWCWGT